MGRKKEIRCYKNKNGYYYINVRGMGFKTTGKKSKKEAMAIGAAQLALLGHGPKSSGTLGEYASPFFTEMCPKNTRLTTKEKPYSPSYLKKSRSYLERFVFNDIISTMPMGSIRRGHVLDFMGRVKAKSGSDNVADGVIKALSVIFEEAIFREDYDRNPASRVRSYVTRTKEIPELPSSLFFEFFPKDSQGPWDSQEERACFMLAAFTGMRRGECLALRWSNIKSYVNKKGQQHYEIHVCEALCGSKKDSNISEPKMGRIRKTPLPAIVYQEFQKIGVASQMLAESRQDYVFQHPLGGHQTFNWWRRSFKKAIKKLGLEDLGLVPHHFRHMLNSHLDGATAIEKELLRESFGWGDEKTRRKYYLEQQSEHLEVISDYLDNFYSSAV